MALALGAGPTESVLTPRHDTVKRAKTRHDTVTVAKLRHDTRIVAKTRHDTV
jgi:hypothetical protein